MLLTPAETACAAKPIASHLRSTCAATYKTPEANGRFDAATNPSPPSPDETYLFEQPSSVLHPDKNYLFCTLLSGMAAKRQFTCQPFSVQMPFFTWGFDDSPGDSHPDIRQPFELVETGGVRVAVFGVVDPDLMHF